MPEVDRLDPNKMPAEYSDYYQADQDVYTIENHPSNGHESWVFSAQIGGNGTAVIGCINLKGTRELEYTYLNYLRLKTILTVFGSIAALVVIGGFAIWKRLVVHGADVDRSSIARQWSAPICVLGAAIIALSVATIRRSETVRR